MSNKVSVIIPVYNVEKYLRQCIESILNQTLSELELICVDDGSTDSSLEILREYEKKDSRVKVLQQENLGAGAARNKGLKIATGKYLSFLDADDFFLPEMLEETYNKCEALNAQICVYQVRRYNDVTKKTWFDKGSFRYEYIPKKEVFSYKDMPDYILDTFQNWAWNKLISHDLVKENNIQFQEILRTNDFLFVALCMTLAQRITVLEKPLVYYRVGMKNNLQSTNYKYPLEFLKAFRAVKKELEEKGIFDEIERSYVNKILSGCIYNLKSIEDKDAKRTLYYELKQNAFDDFRINGKPEAYFHAYNKENYKLYKKICSLEFEEFIEETLQKKKEKKSSQTPKKKEKKSPQNSQDLKKENINIPRKIKTIILKFFRKREKHE